MLYEFYELMGIWLLFRVLNLYGYQLLKGFPKLLANYQLTSAALLLLNLGLFVRHNIVRADPYNLFLAFNFGRDQVFSLHVDLFSIYSLCALILVATLVEILLIHYLQSVTPSRSTDSRDLLVIYAQLQLLIILTGILIVSADVATSLVILPMLLLVLFCWCNRICRYVGGDQYRLEGIFNFRLALVLSLISIIIFQRLLQLGFDPLNYGRSLSDTLSSLDYHHYSGMLVLGLVAMLLLPTVAMHHKVMSVPQNNLLIIGCIVFWEMPIVLCWLRWQFYLPELVLLTEEYRIAIQILLLLHLVWKLGQWYKTPLLQTSGLYLLLQLQLDWLLYTLLFTVQDSQILSILVFLNFSCSALLVWFSYSNLCLASMQQIILQPACGIFKRRYSSLCLLLTLLAAAGLPVFVNFMGVWITVDSFRTQPMVLLIWLGYAVLLVWKLQLEAKTGFYAAIEKSIFNFYAEKDCEGGWRNYIELLPLAILLFSLLLAVVQYTFLGLLGLSE